MKKYLLLVVAVACVMTGCSKIDLDEVMGQSVGTGLGVPIGTLDVTVFDFYKSFDSISVIHFDEDNTVFLYWESPFTIDEFNFQDFSVGEKLEASFSLMDDPTLGPTLSVLPDGASMPLPAGTYNIGDTLKYSFNFNHTTDTSTYYIDSVLVSQAKVALDLNMNGLTLDEGTYLEAELSFPGLAAVKPVKVRALATTNHIAVDRNLGSFLARFGKEGNSSIDMDVALKIVSDGTKTVQKNAAVQLETKFEDMKHQAIWGYIYQSTPICSNLTTITLPNSEMFADFIEKNYVSLYNPEFSISLTTNLGVDAVMKVNEVYAVGKSGKKNAMFRGEKNFTQTINTAQHEGDTANTTITINRNFGEMNELFKEVPDSIVMDWDVYVGNPEPTHKNFIVDPIKLDAKFSVRVPLWFDKETNINAEDTIAADLTSINGDWTNYVDINTFQFYLDFANSLPVHANARIAFLDSLGNELFVKESLDIPCPKVDEMGCSTEIAESEQMVEVEHGKVADIIKTKKIAIKITVDGYDEESTINFHATDGIRVKVSAYANMDFSIPKN